ncbi:MAG: DUF839 domain-containing protein [Chitinophagales bacterium]|nr:DUF839 domain-containing protein [Chitinophagales bacterium]
MNYSRRTFIEFLGKGSVLGVSSIALAPLLKACKTEPTEATETAEYAAKILFESVVPNSNDAVTLAQGFKDEVLITFGDKISAKDFFGTHSDYIAFIPLNEDASEGILWNNHEYLDPVLMGTYAPYEEKTKEQVDKERYVVGGSFVHIKLSQNGLWSVVQDSEYNIRVNGNTEIPFLWDEKVGDTNSAIGTMGNCAGGITPWGTILTCEENTDMFYGEDIYDENGTIVDKTPSDYHWDKFYDYPTAHFGWVVECNPKTGENQKIVAMGKCAHECATVHQLEDGRVVVYSGDDSNDRCLYKYVSNKANDLKDGTLYVANLEEGKWLTLNYNENEVLQQHFKNQTEVLVRLREAAYLVGGSKLNRPEDIEIDPVTGDVLVALTNNIPKGDYHGSIVKIIEDSADKTGTTFKSEVFQVGGKEHGFSCPDNMAFDPKGNFWFTTDVSGSSIGKGEYEFMLSNGLFLIPRTGEKAGQILRVATAPHDAEFTGPFFHPSGKYLFLSVQHPGEKSKSIDELTSHWPDGGDAIPKSGVIVISGESLDALMV